MRALKEIVAANRDAVEQGVTEAGAVGTVKKYNVFFNNEQIKTNVTVGECADIRSIQGQCKFVLVE